MIPIIYYSLIIALVIIGVARMVEQDGRFGHIAFTVITLGFIIIGVGLSTFSDKINMDALELRQERETITAYIDKEITKRSELNRILDKVVLYNYKVTRYNVNNSWLGELLVSEDNKYVEPIPYDALKIKESSLIDDTGKTNEQEGDTIGK